MKKRIIQSFSLTRDNSLIILLLKAYNKNNNHYLNDNEKQGDIK